jgi:hypothetical protein
MVNQSSSIEVVLPNNGKESVEFFRYLQKLLGRAAYTSGESEVVLTTADLCPKIIFRLNDENKQAIVALNIDGDRTYLPKSFTSCKIKAKQFISLVEAVKRLEGCIRAVDHVGIVVPSDIANDEWNRVTNLLAANTYLFDYPSSEEYDNNSLRWLFVVPTTEAEKSKEAPTEIRAGL